MPRRPSRKLPSADDVLRALENWKRQIKAGHWWRKTNNDILYRDYHEYIPEDYQRRFYYDLLYLEQGLRLREQQLTEMFNILHTAASSQEEASVQYVTPDKVYVIMDEKFDPTMVVQTKQIAQVMKNSQGPHASIHLVPWYSTAQFNKDFSS